MSERSLWCAVLNQAFCDATKAINNSDGSEIRLAKDHAYQWLKNKNMDCQMVCDLAGIDIGCIDTMLAKAQSGTKRPKLYNYKTGSRRIKPRKRKRA